MVVRNVQIPLRWSGLFSAPQPRGKRLGIEVLAENRICTDLHYSKKSRYSDLRNAINSTLCQGLLLLAEPEISH